MVRYVLKRLLAMIPTLLGITFVTFLMIDLAPGDPVAAALGAGTGPGTSEGGGGARETIAKSVEAKKKLLGILTEDRTLRAWEAPPPGESATVRSLDVASRSDALGSWARAVAPGPDGSLVVGTQSGDVLVVLVADGTIRDRLPAHDAAVWAVAYEAGAGLVASGDADGVLHLASLADGRRLADPPRASRPVRDLVFAAGGSRLVAACDDGTLRAYDATTGSLLAERREHTGSVAALAVSPDGRRIWSGGFDRKLREWDAASLEPLGIVGTHGQSIGDLAVSADGRRLASACDDRVVRVFRLDDPSAPPIELRGHVQEATSVALSADGSVAWSGGRDESVLAWDVGRAATTARAAVSNGPSYAVWCAPDGRRAWTASQSWVKAPAWERYARWLGKIVTFDFDRSLTDERRVSEKILKALPVTLGLNLIAVLIIYLVSIPIGVVAAVRRGSVFDTASSVVLFLLYSMPSFWVATLLITNFSSERAWNLVPCVGLHATDADRLAYVPWLKDAAAHLVLPVVVLTYAGFAGLSRYVRTSMLETIAQDYVRTARAKGLSERVVVYKHAFRNALVTIVTLVATLLPGMIGGSVIVESIFTIQGMGWLGFSAILERDYPVVMAVTTMSAALTLVGMLVSDLLYSVVDPRIRHA